MVPKGHTAYLCALLRVMAAHTEVITEHCVVDLWSAVYLFVFVCALIRQEHKWTCVPYLTYPERLHTILLFCVQYVYCGTLSSPRHTNCTVCCFTCVFSVGLIKWIMPHSWRSGWQPLSFWQGLPWVSRMTESSVCVFTTSAAVKCCNSYMLCNPLDFVGQGNFFDRTIVWVKYLHL